MNFFGFHPIIERWFHTRFDAPTEPQQEGWPAIAAGEHTLIAAPTGSGKTLTAFLSCIDRLLKESLDHPLPNEVRVVYVSPLRALSNDMHRNLEVPLREIESVAAEWHCEGERGGVSPPVELRGQRTEDREQTTERTLFDSHHSPVTTHQSPIRAGLRTGDTTSSQRAALVRKPPHILVTTPESLYLLLTSPKARETLRNVETVIVDEIHALIRDKRGSHLALSLERLEALSTKRIQRIGLSATQKPLDQVAAFLVGQASIGRKPADYSERSCAPAPSSGSRPMLAQIINVGHQRQLDLAIETPPSELGAVCMHEQWAEVNARLVELVQSHRSTLIFVNTRRLAERLTHQLTELLGEDAVSSHHGSLSAPIRLKTEHRLKTGELKAVVATASLELGIDVGYIDLVIQIGSPRSIATFLQRIGRSGHSLGLIPKGRLFALTRDELMECLALMRAIKAGRLDVIKIPVAPLDVLAQQIVAEVSTRDCTTDELFELFRRAYPYRELKREQFNEVVEFLSEGIERAGGRSRVYLHHDHVGKKLRARKGARIPATSNAGAIPETFQFRVVAEPDRTVVGTLDEDFAIESQAGDIFLLGNTSWRILNVRGGEVNVADAHGAPPTIPFWFGEAPGRTWELSEEVSRLRAELDERLRNEDVGRIVNPSEPTKASRATSAPGGRSEDGGQRSEGRDQKSDVRGQRSDAIAEESNVLSSNTVLSTQYSVPSTEFVDDTSSLNESEPPTLHQSPVTSHQSPPTTETDGLTIRPTEHDAIITWLTAEANCAERDAAQAVAYAAAQKAAIGLLPTQDRVVFERFFDESGGMQLVVHAPFGGAVNRAWGLAMRKRFCRSYDFELQATADDDGFILSLGPQHSFQIESLFPMLRRHNAQTLLEQAVLAVPMFELRWRWNVTRSLLVLRRNAGKKVPPAIQRFRSEDLLTAVFPRLTGCQEEHTGDIPIPDHPLVRQTMHDCLTEALDIDALNEVLDRIDSGAITLVARDTREPSPFSYELLNANPYAFLDGGEIQERRTRAVSTRRSIDDVDDLGRLDPEAIARVRLEAQPPLRDAEEFHDLLLSRIVLPADEFAGSERASIERWVEKLAKEKRVATAAMPDGRSAWVTAERLPAALAIFPNLQPTPTITAPSTVRHDWSDAEARTTYIRGLIEICGPITSEELAARLCLTQSQCEASLEALEGEGLVLRGKFSPALTEQQSEDWASIGRQPADDVDELERAESSSGLRPMFATVEWCHRRLLARIHRLTLQGLRKQIEPVDVHAFTRFLFRHHGITKGFRRGGANGVFESAAMLQGIDAPAVAWERDILPLRIDKYAPSLLDELCLTGEIGWGRMNPAKRDPEKGRPMASLTRVAPISLLLREDADWLIATAGEIDTSNLSSPAQEVFELLQQRGAMFATDLLAESRMLPGQLDDALGELVTRGLLTADGFGGLRRLIAEKQSNGRRGSWRRSLARKRSGSGTVGRWSIWREPVAEDGGRRTEDGGQRSGVRNQKSEVRGQQEQNTQDKAPSPNPESAIRNPQSAIEQWAWQLLRRWGVVFRDLLNRESAAPRWWELLQVYRRLEARGEIRGGRFIKGVAGEQFAAGDVVRQLRQIRDEQPSDDITVISAADPLNLIGIITDRARVPSTASNRIAFINGKPVAALQGGTVEILFPMSPELEQRVRGRLEAGSLLPPAIEASPGRRPIDHSGASEEPPSSDERRSRSTQPRYPNGIPRPRF